MTVLICHPQTPSGAVRRIQAQVVRGESDRLTVSYAIEGDLDRVRIPSPRRPLRAERLWQHTCCEIFVARKGSPAYHEFNFSPSGEWAANAFKRYREGAALDAPDPGVAMRKTAGKLELEAVIPAATGAMRVALAAVIEENDGRLSFWALRHAPGKPDFHHPEAFALELG